MNYLFGKKEEEECTKLLTEPVEEIEIDVPENFEDSEDSGPNRETLSDILKQNVKDYHRGVNTQAILCFNELEEDGVISFFEERIKYKIIEHCSTGYFIIRVLSETHPETSEMYTKFQKSILKFGKTFVTEHEQGDYESIFCELIRERLVAFLNKEGFKKMNNYGNDGYRLKVSISNREERYRSEIRLDINYK